MQIQVISLEIGGFHTQWTRKYLLIFFFKRKTISKPEKSSLSYTSQGKTTILRRANNGMQWFTLLFAISMALFYLIILIYA